jgi:murein L,D-transpeptidase YafK
MKALTYKSLTDLEGRSASACFWALCAVVGLMKDSWAKGACSERGNTVIVEIQEKRLYLCQKAGPVQSYPIALGRGGVGKRAYRDNKTPIGRYPLDASRESSRFHIFIPIAYPTKDQRELGYTGRDIGIHGPTRLFKWAGRLNTWFNWTEGCIAVGSDREIDEIAAWVQDKSVRSVIIE